ncbi:ankyrin repeat and SOCS box protein 17-like isoform X2 [Ictalurus furcatus]|uniref:ankyrin repeat and SOCS box protein 17-like isoform X2 n=1 Tax=Ictalurus furcatus TaxID=66913 RepID=UPI002350389F|nr:ankyrin repeat and SOCS box protein 17-like isoform X2 [Ictalurus furcatus]
MGHFMSLAFFQAADLCPLLYAAGAAAIATGVFYYYIRNRGSDPADPAFYALIHDVVPNATPEQFNSFINAVPSYPGSYFYGMDFTRVSREQYAVMITQYVLQHRRTDLIRVLLQITMECESQSYRQHRLWLPRHIHKSDFPKSIACVLPVVRSRQCEILKVFLQYGMLEHFPNPASIITWILFTPIPNDTPFDTIIICAQECMVLCLRVITYINITHIQRFIRRNHTPLLLDWRSRIPACRYREPCELVHLCRVALRKRLLITGGLPDAIRDLPLERRLQDYLNLEY